jgi:hypothetical protein
MVIEWVSVSHWAPSELSSELTRLALLLMSTRSARPATESATNRVSCPVLAASEGANEKVTGDVIWFSGMNGRVTFAPP